jgi:bacteriorhodopsin
VVDSARNKVPASALVARNQSREFVMGRYLLLWLLGVPIPILLLIWAFGGLT